MTFSMDFIPQRDLIRSIWTFNADGFRTRATFTSVMTGSLLGTTSSPSEVSYETTACARRISNGSNQGWHIGLAVQP